MMIEFLTIVAVSMLTRTAAGNTPVTLLTDTKARCMDGTLSGYYYQANTKPDDVGKWVIHLQGGGECASKESCYGELASSLGSSKYFDSSMQMWFFNYDNTDWNIDFGGANHVHIPYCSRDLHSGTVITPSEATWGLYFSGHLVFEAVVDELIAKYNLSNATDIILAGDSAGGIGVWMNLDYFAERIHTINSKTRVVGATIAGFYFYANDPYTGPDHTSSTLANFSESGMATAYNLWQSYVDQSCLEAKLKNSPPDPHACTLSTYSYPYIDTETFIIEAQTDQVVLEAHDWVPSPPTLCNNPELQYVASWRDEMLQHLTEHHILDLNNTHSGAFVPACYTHTGFDGNLPKISATGSSIPLHYYEAFGNWYYQRTSSSSYKLYDQCAGISDPTQINAKDSLFCNPSCSSPC